MTSKQRFYVGAVHFLAVESNTNTASPGLADFFQARSLLTSSDWTHYSVFPVASILRLPFLTSHHHISQQSENPNEDGHLVSVCTQNVTYARCAHKQKAFHTCTGTCSWTFTHTFSLSSLSAILAHSVQSSWGGIQTVWHLMWLCVSLWPLSLFSHTSLLSNIQFVASSVFFNTECHHVQREVCPRPRKTGQCIAICENCSVSYFPVVNAISSKWRGKVKPTTEINKKTN